MTETERKALALVNEVLAEWGVPKKAVEVPKNSDAFARALCRAIEQHEAFRQEVSDAVREWYDGIVPGHFQPFLIIAKPDPLVEALNEAGDTNPLSDDAFANAFRAALAARGLKIVEVE